MIFKRCHTGNLIGLHTRVAPLEHGWGKIVHLASEFLTEMPLNLHLSLESFDFHQIASSCAFCTGVQKCRFLVLCSVAPLNTEICFSQPTADNGDGSTDLALRRPMQVTTSSGLMLEEG